jgi:hypothetical protein
MIANRRRTCDADGDAQQLAKVAKRGTDLKARQKTIRADDGAVLVAGEQIGVVASGGVGALTRRIAFAWVRTIGWKRIPVVVVVVSL